MLIYYALYNGISNLVVFGNNLVHKGESPKNYSNNEVYLEFKIRGLFNQIMRLSCGLWFNPQTAKTTTVFSEISLNMISCVLSQHRILCRVCNYSQAKVGSGGAHKHPKYPAAQFILNKSLGVISLQCRTVAFCMSQMRVSKHITSLLSSWTVFSSHFFNSKNHALIKLSKQLRSWIEEARLRQASTRGNQTMRRPFSLFLHWERYSIMPSKQWGKAPWKLPMLE